MPSVARNRHPMARRLVVALRHACRVLAGRGGGRRPPPSRGGGPGASGWRRGVAGGRGAPRDAAPLIAPAYANEGRPYARVVDRKVVIDRGTRTVEVTYVVEAGPKVRFGPV